MSQWWDNNQEGCEASDNCLRLGLNICEMFLTRRQDGSQMFSQQQNHVLMFDVLYMMF